MSPTPAARQTSIDRHIEADIHTHNHRPHTETDDNQWLEWLPGLNANQSAGYYGYSTHNLIYILLEYLHLSHTHAAK